MNPYQSLIPKASNETGDNSLSWFSSFRWAIVLFAIPSVASRICIPLGYLGTDYAFRHSSTAWRLGSCGSILIAAIAFAWIASHARFRSHRRCLSVLMATTSLAFGPIILYRGNLPDENDFLMISVFTVLGQSAICGWIARTSISKAISVVFLALLPYGLGCAMGAIDVIVVALADP